MIKATLSEIREFLVSLTCNAHIEYLFGETLEQLGGKLSEMIILSQRRDSRSFEFRFLYLFEDNSLLTYSGTGLISAIYKDNDTVSSVNALIRFKKVTEKRPGRPSLVSALPNGDDDTFSRMWNGGMPRVFYPRGLHGYGSNGFGSFVNYPVWPHVHHAPSFKK